MAEILTRDLTRGLLEKYNYTKNSKGINGFYIYQEDVFPEGIKTLLKFASKTGKKQGKPDFGIYHKDSDIFIIIECKESIKYHKTDTLSKKASFACDGAIHYASKLKEHYNVIAIGVSGIEEEKLLIDNYLWLKGDESYLHINDLINDITDFETYKNYVYSNPKKEKLDTENLIKFAQNLHENIYYYADIKSEDNKALLVSGILLALQDKGFRAGYKDYANEDLPEHLITSIKNTLNKSNIYDKITKVPYIMKAFNFIETTEELKKQNKDLLEANKENINLESNPLKYFIMELESNVYHMFNNNNSIDIIGKFYKEFIKFTGNQNNFGIVLTPQHITELFAEMAQLTIKSKVLDICTGTGGFLVSAMINMINKVVSGDKNKIIDKIKRENLIGVENDFGKYVLMCSNLIIRGDGESQLYKGNCFELYEEDTQCFEVDPETGEIDVQRMKNLITPKIINVADVGMINPPYALRNPELEFVNCMLNSLKDKGTGIAIVPMSCATTKNDHWKTELLKNHTLEAVMTMPIELFRGIKGDNAGTCTCIMVFTAHKPHGTSHKTWFANWKNDGFVWTRKEGRIDQNNKWELTKKIWVNSFASREVSNPKESLSKHVDDKMEWCFEAYVEPDYSCITKELFEKELKRYALYKFIQEEGII